MAKKKQTTGDLSEPQAEEKLKETLAKVEEELETFDGADEDVSVGEGEVASPPPRAVDVQDAEIIEDEPQAGEEVEEADEPVAEEPEATAPEPLTVSREELEKKGVLPPGTQPKQPKKNPVADAVQKEVGTPQMPPPQAQNQLSEDDQQKIWDHQSQQGSIALKLIEAMLSNPTLSNKKKPKDLVDNAYAIVDELQSTLDKRHKDALMEAFSKLNM